MQSKQEGAVDKSVKRPFIYVGVLGVLILFLSVVLLATFPRSLPWMPKGMWSSFLAFQFVEDASHISKMFSISNSLKEANLVHQMNRGNQVDYLYILVYSTFLFLFLRQVSLLMQNKKLTIGYMLIGCILVADGIENTFQIHIANHYNKQSIDIWITYLKIMVWLKWAGLSIIFLVLRPYFRNMRHRLGWIMHKICILPAIFFVLAFFFKGVYIELLAISVAIVFLFMIVFSFVYRTDIKQYEAF